MNEIKKPNKIIFTIWFPTHNFKVEPNVLAFNILTGNLYSNRWSAK